MFLSVGTSCRLTYDAGTELGEVLPNSFLSIRLTFLAYRALQRNCNRHWDDVTHHKDDSTNTHQSNLSRCLRLWPSDPLGTFSTPCLSTCSTQ